jgi:hypothetical protein
MTSPAQRQLIDLLERTGTDRADVRQLVRTLGRPSPRPAHMQALEDLIEEFGPDLAAQAVVEAYRGGLAG